MSDNDSRPARHQALVAVHGPRVILLFAGSGDDEVSFGAKLPDAKEWARVVADISGGASNAQEMVLRRSIVGVTEDETRTERARLESLLDEDPPLADLWGLQLLAAVGFGAKATTVPAGDGLFDLTADVGDVKVAVQCKKRSRSQWNALRDVMTKKGQTEGAAAAYEMLVVSPNKADVAARYPALVTAFGEAACSAGSRSGGVAAPFGLPG